MNVLSLVGRGPYALTAFGVLLFLVYAINFLYFFVDDEAITMVYAQNLLRGRGLTYSAVEGTTEGYSNFLHVWMGALLIWVTDLADLPKAAVFAFGSAFSLLCGAAIVAIVARLLQRLVSDDAWAQAAALSFLALAGPLAVWSSSALETVPSAAAFTGFAAILLIGEPRRIWPALALGIAVLLFRVDGFLGVGLALIAAFVAAPCRRQELLTIGSILAAVFVVYNAWRWWYFGSLLSLPLQTKVLFKLLPAEGVVTQLPQAGYLERFLEAYHVVPLLLVSLGWLPFWRPGDDRSPFAFLLIVVGWSAYAAVIGDWMFGFRFFVVIFPALSILAGFSLGRLRRHAPRLAIPAAIVLIAWSAWSAERFIVAFEQSDPLARWQRWWRDPSFEAKRYFEPYYSMYRDLKDRIPPGSITINNQAGFLPFMLDSHNIDDLGITSRFFATLPTADVIFTEVGRYHPFTHRPPLTAGETYLAQSDARYLIIWKHMMANRNGGQIPLTLLDNHFRLAHTSDHQVMYERSRAPMDADVDDFHESVTHPANVNFVALRGTEIPRGELQARAPFLSGGAATLSLNEPLRLEMHLDGHPVHALWLDRLESDFGAQVTLAIRDSHGRQVFRDVIEVPANGTTSYHRRLDRPIQGATVMMTATPSAATAGTLELRDFRVMGQPDDLREHIDEELSDEF